MLIYFASLRRITPKTANATPAAISTLDTMFQPDHRPEYDSKAKIPKDANPLPNTIKGTAIFLTSPPASRPLADGPLTALSIRPASDFAGTETECDGFMGRVYLRGAPQFPVRILRAVLPIITTHWRTIISRYSPAVRRSRVPPVPRTWGQGKAVRQSESPTSICSMQWAAP
jgi:hypothetical protein